MNTLKLKLFVPVAMLLLVSCDTLMHVGTLVTEQPLTTQEVSGGLKEALAVGVDSAVVRLSKEGGYYLQEQVKIHLPPEADMIVDNLTRIPGMDKAIEQMEIKLNRAAEDAAKTAAPIFAQAIREMTFDDAWEILRGSDTAAVHYLRTKTYAHLYDAFKPKVTQSLDKPLVANVSANESWETVTAQWNTFAGSFAGQLMGVKKVNAQLDTYVTQMALEGLFYKVGEQEKAIRTDTHAQVSSLLRRVFGGSQ